MPHPMFLLTAIIVLGLALVTAGAIAHEAPAGWSYPTRCCSGVDCREVKPQAIDELPTGYLIRSTGEIVGYHDPRVRNSPDGMVHWCSVRGEEKSGTICLFVPPKGF